MCVWWRFPCDQLGCEFNQFITHISTPFSSLPGECMKNLCFAIEKQYQRPSFQPKLITQTRSPIRDWHITVWCRRRSIITFNYQPLAEKQDNKNNWSNKTDGATPPVMVHIYIFANTWIYMFVWWANMRAGSSVEKIRWRNWRSSTSVFSRLRLKSHRIAYVSDFVSHLCDICTWRRVTISRKRLKSLRYCLFPERIGIVNLGTHKITHIHLLCTGKLAWRPKIKNLTKSQNKKTQSKCEWD